MRIRIVPIALCVLLAACATSRPPQRQATLPPPPPAGEPIGIAGLSAQSVRVAFGAPSFVRKDGSMEMWRYDSPACRAFFFLYANGSDMNVRHVETLPRGATMAADVSCLDALRARASAKVS